jgi:aspartate aminotransferase-like enzyme
VGAGAPAGAHDAITIVHSETSTGVLNPLAEIAAAVRSAERSTGQEILTIVDGVTSVAGSPVETDDWALDWVLTGSQKALALPPGLAFGSPSERLLARAATIPARGQYFDLLAFQRNWEKYETPNTPAVTLVFALLAQLRRIETEGVDARMARHRAMAERCWQWTREVGSRFGLTLFAPDGYRAWTVTAIEVPERLPGTEIVSRLKQRGYTIGNGYGRLKGLTIRIGHMGDHTVDGLNQLLEAVEEVLEG